MRERKYYNREFRNQALERAFMRNGRTIESIASDLNISTSTLRTWMRRDKKLKNRRNSKDSKRPGERSRVEKLELLMESHGLDDAGLSAFCRERGIFAHHLVRWRKEFETGGSRGETTELQELKQSKKQLERELKRKEKALAEAAALLVLKKKYEGLWEDEDE